MPGEYQIPLRTRLADRAKWLAGPMRRRWLRWRSFARPLPQDWWPQFEQDFRTYCAATTPPRSRRRNEPDR